MAIKTKKKIFLTVNASWTLFLKKKECRSVKIKILETLHQVKINHKKVTEILKEGEEIKKNELYALYPNAPKNEKKESKIEQKFTKNQVLECN